MTIAADKRSRSSPGVPERLRRRWPRLALWAAAAVVAFVVYLSLARTRAVNSDGSSIALQAWDLIHGNPLLHGWMLADVTFYTLEMPGFALAELAHGLTPGVVQIGAAALYTLLLLFAVALARGSATGREAVLRTGLAAGILLAPELASGTNQLLSSPDHIGSTVPVLIAWLILDRAPRRWWVPVVVTVLLAWTAIGDQVVLAIAAAPLAAISLLRLRRSPERWFELSLAAGGAVAAAAGLAAPRLMRAAGGFDQQAVASAFQPPGVIAHRILPVTGKGILVLFGASTPGLPPSQAWFAALHVVSLALVAAGIALTARRFFAESLVPQLLLTGMAVVLVAYLTGYVHADSVANAREISAIVPFGAVLAARQVAPHLAAPPPGRRIAAAARVATGVLAAVLAGYVAGLAVELTAPPAPPQASRLTGWLEKHPLGGAGLSGYWSANVVTLTSGGTVRVRAVDDTGGLLTPHLNLMKPRWYDPKRSYADFVVLAPAAVAPGYPGLADRAAATRSFGPPARVYHVGPYTVLQWHKNLLADLRRYPPAADREASAAA